MRAGLFAVLVVSSAQVGSGSHKVGGDCSIPRVPSLEGGTSSPGKSTAVGQQQHQQQRALHSSERSATAAWALPWLPRRRRRERKESADTTSGRVTAPAVDAAAGIMSPASAFNGALASIVGAILIGGGTLSLSPQVVDASPFDPRPPPKSARQPFFEGWFIRWVGSTLQVGICCNGSKCRRVVRTHLLVHPGYPNLSSFSYCSYCSAAVHTSQQVIFRHQAAPQSSVIHKTSKHAFGQGSRVEGMGRTTFVGSCEISISVTLLIDPDPYGANSTWIFL